MQFSAYEAWVNSGRAKLVLETGAVETHYSCVPTSAPNVPPWKLEWFIEFLDTKYIRICENFRAHPGGLDGERYHFSYHYGPKPTHINKRGLPSHGPKQPLVLRIDLLTTAHLHYLGPDHKEQKDVNGFVIMDADMFTFIDLVQKHRATAVPLDKLFGFTIR